MCLLFHRHRLKQTKSNNSKMNPAIAPKMIPISAPLESVDPAEEVEEGDAVVGTAADVVEDDVTLEELKDDVEGVGVEEGDKEDDGEGVAVEDGKGVVKVERGVAVGEAADGDDEGGYKPP